MNLSFLKLNLIKQKVEYKNKTFLINKYDIKLFFIINVILLQTSKASLSCPIPGSTVDVVEMCPDTEEKWKKAAARKNCIVCQSM